MPNRIQRLGALAAGLAFGLVAASPAYAASTSIDHVQPEGDALQVVVSLSDVPDGVTPDLATATATFGGEAVPATAEPISDADVKVQRTAILALDVSDSMKGERFAQAKAAANAFLDNVPSDVSIGLITFAADVDVVRRPTLDTESVRTAIAKLQLSRQTRLYDGLAEAVAASGDIGARSVLVLSDGRDTSSRVRFDDVLQKTEDSEVKVDVVALAQKAADTELLQQLADAGNGSVLPADDPRALTGVFAEEAQELAQQVLVTVRPPAELAGKEGTLAVTLQVDGSPVTDEAFVGIPAPRGAAGGGEAQQAPQPVQPSFAVPAPLMYAGLGAAVLAVAFIVVIAFGGSSDDKQDTIDRNIEAYTRAGARKLAQAQREAGNQSVAQQAVAMAESVLENQKGVEEALGSRLEAAGLALKPAEWLLIHVGVTFGVGLVALLFSAGNVLFLLMGLLLGGALPWMFLMLKQRRRLAAFKAQLADTLQLMAGSLSAGMSLAQSVDTVVKEGLDPIAGEFRRALVETRLGVEIEDALSGVAERMRSVDFEWVVMAIRIQREVGGNLSELLTKVAETIREREYLERQVKTLSAEGRLSVWILGGLPPAFMAYLAVANPSYVSPLFTDPIGWILLIGMTVMLSVGIFWMKKVVKVEI